MENRKSYLTFSVDDGHPTDFRAAELLSRYGMKATFYIPKENPEREVLDAKGIRQLSQDFEVGGHTLSHLSLTRMAPGQARKEIADGKNWLEQVLGKPAHSFCYPQGKFNAGIVEMVKNAGFWGARTCMQNLTEVPSDPFLWGITTQAYSHSPAVQIRHALLEGNFRGCANYFKIHRLAVDWVAHFKKAVKHVSSRGGVTHLYFHSWEIDEQGQWAKLEELLKWLSHESDFSRVTNGELFGLRRPNVPLA